MIMKNLSTDVASFDILVDKHKHQDHVRDTFQVSIMLRMLAIKTVKTFT